MSTDDVIAIVKNRGFDAERCIWNNEKLYIFREWIFMGYVDVNANYEELNLALTEYALEIFE